MRVKIASKKPTPTKIKHENGFSLIEVLIAALMFAILLLGLIQYQQNLFARHQHFYNRLQAERIAFQLLESYPKMPYQIIPKNWQYQVKEKFYSSECKIVQITITQLTKQKIVQKQLFCA